VDTGATSHARVAADGAAGGLVTRAANENLEPSTSITSRRVSVPDEYHVATSVTSRQVSLRDKYDFATGSYS
jgi:hypothetical protein